MVVPSFIIITTKRTNFALCMLKACAFIYISVEAQSISQSINQSVSQSINQSSSQSVSQSINQSVSQSVNQSINQSVNQSINQSVSQSVSQSINQSINGLLSIAALDAGLHKHSKMMKPKTRWYKTHTKHIYVTLQLSKRSSASY